MFKTKSCLLSMPMEIYDMCRDSIGFLINIEAFSNVLDATKFKKGLLLDVKSLLINTFIVLERPLTGLDLLQCF